MLLALMLDSNAKAFETKNQTAEMISVKSLYLETRIDGNFKQKKTEIRMGEQSNQSHELKNNKKSIS